MNFAAFAQVNPVSFNSQDVDFKSPRSYTISDIKVQAGYNIDENQVITKSGLQEGSIIKVPGPEITKAIKNLWKENQYKDVEIVAETIKGNQIVLLIKLVPEMVSSGRIDGKGVSRSEHNKFEEAVTIGKGEPITPEFLNKVKRVARGIQVEKGYYKATCKIDTILSPVGGIDIRYEVIEGPRYKINEIIIEGNNAISDAKIKRKMKETKEMHWYRIFWRSKFNSTKYKEDKLTILNTYVDMAYRDAEITFDTIYDFDASTLNIKMVINEGSKYYIRSIDWVGNVTRTDGKLDTILAIKAGDTYNQSVLDTRLYMNPAGNDVTSEYMDDGYLFFQVTPIEKHVVGDSVDLEFRIYEGKQARIRTISIAGNTKTSDHVIIRDLYTRPGDLFSREAVINSQRLLSQTGYFNAESLGVNPIPNPADGTVDIEYTVEESPSDQIELSGGFGAGRVVGTLGLTFNNFSAKRLFTKGAWTPLPGGDGQRLSVRAQSNGYWFQSYNFSFTEPWLGGKKPQSFTFSAFRSTQAGGPVYLRNSSNQIVRNAAGQKVKNEDRQYLTITGASVGLGKRLKWPDANFSIYHNLSYQYYDINNYGNIFAFSDGYANNLSYQFNINRNSLDQNLYPRSGQDMKISFKTSLPYSFFDGVDDYSEFSDQQLNKWLEYNKIKFTSSWFTSLSKDRKLVLNTRVGVGLLNSWTNKKGVTPFERFYAGGSGLTGFNIDGREIIAQRGYADGDVSPENGGALITKYTMELRYPLSLNPSATIYVLGFAEAGNTWNSYKDFNPFAVKRSAGLGVRIFLPMFGLMGLDYGFGFDGLDPGAKGYGSFDDTQRALGKPVGQFHFTIGMNLGEL